MSDAGAGADNLHVSRFDSAFVAETIPVCDCPFPDIDEDLDVGMHLQRKARVWRDLFVVPNAHAAPSTLRRIMLRAAGKVTPGFEPAEVLAWELVEGLRSIISALSEIAQAAMLIAVLFRCLDAHSMET